MCICNVLPPFKHPEPSFHPEPPLEQWETKAPPPGPSWSPPQQLAVQEMRAGVGRGEVRTPQGMDAEFCQQSLIITAFREKSHKQ